MGCNNCHKFLSVGPVKVYPHRKIKCGRCVQEDDAGAISRYQLIAEHSVFKCINRFDGCRQLLTLSEVAKHESKCENKTIVCPMCLETTEVPTFLLIKHFKDNHENCFLVTTSFEVDVTVPCMNTYLYKLKDKLFFLECKITSEDTISLNTFYLGEPLEAMNIKQTFSIYCKDVSRKIVTETKTCLAFDCKNSEGFLLKKLEGELLLVVFELCDQENIDILSDLQRKRILQRNVRPKFVLTHLGIYHRPKSVLTHLGINYDLLFVLI
ncbi:hypothetical protein JTB14_007041 [Gonioctena quinquepunctata]|nr:hypothetical protein JTB14_007041 [Gonioctena quinquepunctata]